MSPTNVAELVLLDPDDDVAVAARDLTAGETVSAGSAQRVTLAESVPLGHKVALRAIERGQIVRKYGHPIGLAVQSIGMGAWVHTHNLSFGEFAEGGVPPLQTPPPPAPLADRSFQGYRRAGGRFGTRNYLAVISTVNCSASVSRYVARHFDRDVLRDYPHVDGVIAITHHSGCGMPYGGPAHEMLDRVLGGIMSHPNVASNTPMYQRMIDDMDLDAGVVLQGRSLQAMGGEIFAQVLAVASGQPTKSEVHGIGEEEFLPWIVGPML